jgi:hypothetical protein
MVTSNDVTGGRKHGTPQNNRATMLTAARIQHSRVCAGAPDEMKVGARRLISAEAAAEWRDEREQAAQSA